MYGIIFDKSGVNPLAIGYKTGGEISPVLYVNSSQPKEYVQHIVDILNAKMEAYRAPEIKKIVAVLLSEFEKSDKAFSAIDPYLLWADTIYNTIINFILNAK